MQDKDKLKELFHKAMEIWLPELPDIQLNQFYHNIAFNTENGRVGQRTTTRTSMRRRGT